VQSIEGSSLSSIAKKPLGGIPSISGAWARPWVVAAKFVFGGGMLWVVFSHVDAVKFSHLFETSIKTDILFSIAIFGVAVAFNAHRWFLISKCVGKPVPLKISVLSYFESMFFNQVLPSGIGGDAIRVLRVIENGVSSGDAIVGVMVDRILGLCFVCGCFFVVFILHKSALAGSRLFWVLFVASALILAGCVGMLVLEPLSRLAEKWRWSVPFVALMRGFRRAVISPVWLWLLVDLCAATVCSVASFWMCARALGISIDWMSALLVFQGIAVASIVPATIGGWGVREGVAVLLLSPIGLDASSATAISILFGLVMTAIGLIGAVIWLFSAYKRTIPSILRRGAVG
jgi:uncharacterized membrane protein YbhN (UPF0104 family)